VDAGANAVELGLSGALEATYAWAATAVQIVRQGSCIEAVPVPCADVAAVMTYDSQHRKTRSRELYAFHCEPCGKDTPFQYQQCLYCGTPQFNAVATVLREKKEARKAMPYRQRIAEGARKGFLKADAKREYLKRKAEESRAKWEGRYATQAQTTDNKGD
jgi:hypothetical protein